MLYGVTRIVNFAHGEIIALGAIMTLFFSNPIDSRVLFLDRYSPLGMNFTFSIIISIIICGIFGGLLEIFLGPNLEIDNLSLSGNYEVTVPNDLSILVKGQAQVPDQWLDASVGNLNNPDKTYTVVIEIIDGSQVIFKDG